MFKSPANKKPLGKEATKENGYVITCGWSSSGVGKKYGFDIIEILLISHGSSHNDTICVVERKISTLFA